MTSAAHSKTGSKALSVFLIGCVATPFLIATVIAGLNWSSLVRFAKESAVDYSHLQVVRAAVMRRTGTSTIWIDHVFGGKKDGPTLRIKVVNMPGVSLDQPNLRQVAASIATTAQAALPADHRYRHYTVVLESGAGGPVRFSMNQSFPFEAHDLLSQAGPASGALYSVDNADGGYRVLKILALTDDGMSVTLYGNHFATRPDHVDPAMLSLAPDTVHGYAGPGLAQMTVTSATFFAWQPQLVAFGTATDLRDQSPNPSLQRTSSGRSPG